MSSTRTQRGWLHAILALIVASCSTNLVAQSSTGTISGVVEDSQHAVIAGATITIRNVNTNETQVLRSDDRGLYVASALSPGTYEVTANKQDFAEVKVTSVAVNIAAVSTVNVEMKIGATTATVQVAAETQLIDKSSPTISAAVPTQITENVPLPERSAMEAVMLSPGVQGDPQYNMGVQSENVPVYTQPTTPGGSLAVGGGRPGSAMQLVDGVDLAMVGYARVGITFSSDDLQQITVQSGAISAMYGRSGGGVINQASKAGTTEYHGKLAYRHEDPFFEATTFGQGVINTGHGTVPVTQDVHQNMFTGVFGGPVPLPFRHINKNTFFFASFEPLRAGSKVWSRQRVPTPAEIAGDFSNTYTILNTSILSSQGYAAAVAAPRVGGLYYQFPLNSLGFPTGARYNSSTQYVPIPNNNLSYQLSQNSFAKFVMSQFPQPGPNGQGTSYVNFYNGQATYANDGTNALGARGVQNTDNRYNLRVDHNFGNSDHAFVRYTNVPVSGTRFGFLGPSSVLNYLPEEKVGSQTALLDFTHVFGSSAVNDLRYSYTRMDYLVQPAPSTTTQDWASKYGLTPSQVGAGFPQLAIDTNTYGSSTGGNDGGSSINQVYQLGDDFSFVRGNHNLRFGGEWRALQLDRLPNSGIYGGTYGFSAGTTNSGSAGGNATASFILGSINSLTLAAVQEYYYRFKYFAAYAMDTWKISPRLTLDLGLRYNLEFPRTEKYGLQGSFLPNISGTLNGIGATGAFAFSGHNGLPNTLYPVNYHGFEPRVGFSYTVTPKMTARAAVGLMHAPMTGVSNTNIPALTPNSLNIGGSLGGANPAAWVNYVTNPVSLPSGGVPGVLKGPNPFFSYGTGFLPYVSQSNAVPYAVTWSASTQYQISNSAMVQAAYVGVASHHMFSNPEGTNLMPLSTLESEIQSGFNFNSSATKNIYGLGTGNANINLVPYPQFFNNSILSAWVREGAANYQGFYLNGVERLGTDFTVIGSFTWAKSMDDGSSGTEDGITTDVFGFAYQQQPWSKQGEWSLSTFDIPTHLTAAYIWDLPIGKGKWLNIENRWLNALAGGIHNSGMFSAESGYPAWVTLGSVGYFYSTAPGSTSYGNNGNAIGSGLGGYNIRPNIVPGQPLVLKNWRKDPFDYTGKGGYLNPAAFSVPGSVGNPQFGNAPRTLGARSPHTIYFDMSGSKDIPLHGDRVLLNIRADAINAFNHTNYFLNPNSAHTLTGALNSTTGAYTQASGFGILNNANNNPGRTFAVGAAVVF